MKRTAEPELSLWKTTSAEPEAGADNQLNEDVTVDVCVVGAGLAGMTTAHLLAQHARTVAVLERNYVGAGQTGNTTAHLSNEIDDLYSEIERLRGAEGARLACESHTAAIDRIESIVREEGIDCDFERLDGYLFVPPGESPEVLKKELDAAHRAGLAGVEMPCQHVSAKTARPKSAGRLSVSATSPKRRCCRHSETPERTPSWLRCCRTTPENSGSWAVSTKPKRPAITVITKRCYAMRASMPCTSRFRIACITSTPCVPRTGVHVLCEKPMAVTERECQEMIDTCRERGCRLMIAYRLHFEKSNLEAAELARSGKLGDVRSFSSVFTMQVKPGDIRLQKKLGGGTLYDIGIYCINAARYIFRAEPTSAFAWSVNNGEERFREVDEMTAAVLRFPGERLAQFTTSFGAADFTDYSVVGAKGSLCVENAYEYAEDITHWVSIGDRTRTKVFPQRDQFGPEIQYFADCVLNGREPEPSGEEGLIDVRIIQALYESTQSGKPVKLELPQRRKRPTIAQEIRKPAVEEGELVKTSSPTR